jgi:hypothetical protein
MTNAGKIEIMQVDRTTRFRFFVGFIWFCLWFCSFLYKLDFYLLADWLTDIAALAHCFIGLIVITIQLIHVVDGSTHRVMTYLGLGIEFRGRDLSYRLPLKINGYDIEHATLRSYRIKVDEDNWENRYKVGALSGSSWRLLTHAHPQRVRNDINELLRTSPVEG